MGTGVTEQPWNQSHKWKHMLTLFTVKHTQFPTGHWFQVNKRKMGRWRLRSSCCLHVKIEQKFYLKMPHNLTCMHGSSSTVPGMAALHSSRRGRGAVKCLLPMAAGCDYPNAFPNIHLNLICTSQMKFKKEINTLFWLEWYCNMITLNKYIIYKEWCG